MATDADVLAAEERDLLAECYKRERALAKAARPSRPENRLEGYLWGAEVRALAEQKEYGPRYSAFVWFGKDIGERKRMRYRRSIDSLAARGLLVRTGTGKRLTNLALSPAGERLARVLSSRRRAAKDGAAAK